MAYYLLQAVFIPLLLAPIAYYIGRKYGVGPTSWFSLAVMLYSTTMLIIPFASGYYAEFYPWNQLGEFGLVMDGLSGPFALIIYILSTALVLYSRPYMIHKITEEYHQHLQSVGGSPVKMAPQQVPARIINHNIGIYYALYLVFAMGMLGTVLASNLIQFYIFFEFMLIPSFFLIAFYGYGARKRIALMFFFWTHVGAVVLLLALITLGLSAGSFDMADIIESTIAADLLPFIAAGIIIGLSVKLAMFLVHIWLPHAHAEAPTPISALLSPAMIGIGGYALMRLLMVLMPTMYQETALYLSIWAFITMVYGGAMALMQDDVKRMLAYSSISQMGYFLFGFASLNAIGVTGSLMLYISHGTGKALLFMMTGILIMQVGTRSFSKLGGLAGKLPITATTAIIGALAIMGIPPTNGFMAEWMLFYGALQTALAEGSTLKIIVFSLAISSTVLTGGYILWMIKRIFFGRLQEGLEKVKEGSLYMTVPMMALALFTIVIGIYPEIFTSTIVPFMQSIMG